MKREEKYDLLRIIAAVAVIMIHVSGLYITAYNDPNIFGQIYKNNLLVSIFFNTISRFAVPCFIMLSGAFILSNPKNKNYKYFYKNSFKKIWIHLIIFSILYLLYNITKGILTSNNILFIIKPIKSLIKGEPYSHLWYLYMLIGVYICAPFIICLKDNIGEKNFSKFSWIFLILAIISQNTSSYTLKWDIGFSFSYLGYFMIGYNLKIKSSTNKIPKFIIIFLILGLEMILLLINNICLKANINTELLVDAYSPIVVVYSILVFILVTKMNNIRLSFYSKKISTITFYIYLFQSGVLDMLMIFMRKIINFTKISNLLMIPILIIVVFIISIILSIIYIKMWCVIEKKYKISENVWTTLFERKKFKEEI